MWTLSLGCARVPLEPDPGLGLTQEEGARALGSPWGCRAAGRRGESVGHGHPGHPWVFRQLSLDKELIDFGSYVVGETTSRTITLTNAGGLGTKFKFLRMSESCEIGIAQSAMKMVSVLPIVSRGSSGRGGV